MTDEHVKELVRIKTREAVRRYQRKALVGFAVLIIGVVGGFKVSSDESAARRHDVAQSARVTQVDSCHRGNVVRSIIRSLIEQGEPALKAYRDRGLITPVEYNEALIHNTKALQALHNIDCSHAGDKIKG